MRSMVLLMEHLMVWDLIVNEKLLKKYLWFLEMILNILDIRLHINYKVG